MSLSELLALVREQLKELFPPIATPKERALACLKFTGVLAFFLLTLLVIAVKLMISLFFSYKRFTMDEQWKKPKDTGPQDISTVSSVIHDKLTEDISNRKNL